MIRSGIADAGLEGRLGPKVSVVIDGGGRTALDQVAADVRLTAVTTASGWQVAIAGDARTAQALGLAADDAEACEATLALLSAIAAMGREARARDLDANDANCITIVQIGLGAHAPPREGVPTSEATSQVH